MPIYSHSKLSTYETCPLQYKYRYIDKIKLGRETIEAFVGKRVHESLEKLYKDLKVTKVDSLGDLLTFYNDAWRKNWTENVEIIRKDYTSENYRVLGEKCIRDYYRRFYPFEQDRTLGLEQQIFIDLDESHYEARLDPSRINEQSASSGTGALASEKIRTHGHESMELRRGDYRIIGYIDRISQATEGVIEIHDYKTGQSLPTQESVDQDRQLALYQIGIQQRWPDAKKIKLVWHYLAFDRDLVSERSVEELDTLRQDTKKLIHEIEQTKEFPPKQGAICPWCEFIDICPLMKHQQKVEALSVNEYLNEPGVNLVNRYAELSSQKNKVIKALDEELEKLKKALIEYADKEGVEIIYGSDCKLRVKIKEGYQFPLRNDPRRSDLEKLVKESGEWMNFSDLNLNQLTEALQSEKISNEVRDKILKFAQLEKSYRFYLSKGEA